MALVVWAATESRPIFPVKFVRLDAVWYDRFTSTSAFPFAQIPARGPDIGFTVGGMDHKMTALERAFQLASSGQVSKIAEISGVGPFFAA